MLRPSIIIVTLIACIPLAIANRSIASSPATILLYPGAKLQVQNGTDCRVVENITSDTLTTLPINSYTETSPRKDQNDRTVLKFSKCD